MTTLDIAQIKQKAKDLVRHAALTRVADQSRLTGFELQEISQQHQPGQVLGNLMTIILVTGDSLRITLKLHFTMQDAKQLSYTAFGAESADDVDEGKAIDFVKELSNLTVGLLVKEFESMQIPMGISLPLCTRGFYEVFADYAPAESPLIRFSDLWRLELNGCAINGTAMYEISNVDTLSPLANYEIVAENVDEDDGEFDFL